MRKALAKNPELRAQVPCRPGRVDTAPWGMPTRAVGKSGLVTRQGVFTDR